MAVASQAPPEAVEPTSGGGAPVSMANTKSEIAEAAVDAGFFDTVEEAETWTKAELLALWNE